MVPVGSDVYCSNSITVVVVVMIDGAVAIN